MVINDNSILNYFFEAVDLFIDCIRTNKGIYIAIIILFCLFFMGVILCMTTYHRNKQDLKIRLKMISYGLLSLTCFCMFMINLLFTWQIAIPASIITLLLIFREKKICYNMEIEKELSKNTSIDKNIVFNPFYIRCYFLIIISFFIAIICQILFIV